MSLEARSRQGFHDRALEEVLGFAGGRCVYAEATRVVCVRAKDGDKNGEWTSHALFLILDVREAAMII